MSMIFLLLGGLGMFLFGMKMMSDGLENMAGDKMRRTLEILTTNRLAGVAVGAGVTAAVQSSSATTVMVIGFVNAGLMTLLQATGVIMGANIGTTITAQIIAFKLSDIAPMILFIGMFMSLFIKKKNIRKIGEIVLGFGILFVGLDLMSQSMIPLRHDEGFQRFLVNFENPLIGILVGTVFTAIIQSSSASVGILQTLAAMGLIDLKSAVFVVLGQNIGTCVTAILSAIGANTAAKRAAGIHLVFNIIGSIVYIPLLIFFPHITSFIASLTPFNVSRQIANFHTFFNITVTVLLFPFAKLMVNLVSRIIKDKPEEEAVEHKLIYLDERITQTPAIALSQTLKELNRMSEIVYDNFKLATESFFEGNEEKINKVFEVEELIDFLSNSISQYLIEFKGLKLSETDLKIMGSLHHVIIDLERVGDLAENIAQYAQTMSDKNLKLSPEGATELRAMSEKTLTTLQTAFDVFRKRDKSLLHVVESMEREVDYMRKTYIENHINRLQERYCDPQVGVVFTNMVAALERIADHANNIAYSIS
ncbi:MAG: Na/Pi cotransporter family protein [Clostridiaceae bacterium]|nr:Na/Pi cotransporter family protein [Clostridiaceae bacterium]